MTMNIPTRAETLARKARLGYHVAPPGVDLAAILAEQRRIELESLAKEESLRGEKERSEAERLGFVVRMITGSSCPANKNYPVKEIISACSAVYGVSELDIYSARRQAEIVKPRHIAMYLSKTLTRRSFPDIGARFGDRDHTTILHASKKIANLIARGEMRDPTREVVAAIEAKRFYAARKAAEAAE